MKNASPDQVISLEQTEGASFAITRSNRLSFVLVFIDAIDSLVYSGVAATRWEAIQLGRKLARELKLFKHVTGDHEFRDEYLFYHYQEDACHFSSSLGESLEECSEDLSALVPHRSEIAEKADAFRMLVDVRDRRYRMQTYKECFIGSGKPSLFGFGLLESTSSP
jgi:hypothetical protein